MKEKLYIVGAGGVGGHVALNLHEYTDRFKVECIFDDDPEKIGTVMYGFEVSGPVNDVLKLSDAAVLVGIAFPRIKREIVTKLSENRSVAFPTLIHESAWISNKVSIGRGCIIYPGTTINFGSEINDFVVLNANCTLGHHTVVGNHSSFAPGVSTGGHTVIEDAVDVGIGVSTLQYVRVGSGSTIGGQSMVINDVDPESVVAGVPARFLS